MADWVGLGGQPLFSGLNDYSDIMRQAYQIQNQMKQQNFENTIRRAQAEYQYGPLDGSEIPVVGLDWQIHQQPMSTNDANVNRSPNSASDDGQEDDNQGRSPADVQRSPAWRSPYENPQIQQGLEQAYLRSLNTPYNPMMAQDMYRQRMNQWVQQNPEYANNPAAQRFIARQMIEGNDRLISAGRNNMDPMTLLAMKELMGGANQQNVADLRNQGAIDKTQMQQEGANYRAGLKKAAGKAQNPMAGPLAASKYYNMAQNIDNQIQKRQMDFLGVRGKVQGYGHMTPEQQQQFASDPQIQQMMQQRDQYKQFGDRLMNVPQPMVAQHQTQGLPGLMGGPPMSQPKTAQGQTYTVRGQTYTLDQLKASRPDIYKKLMGQ